MSLTTEALIGLPISGVVGLVGGIVMVVKREAIALKTQEYVRMRRTWNQPIRNVGSTTPGGVGFTGIGAVVIGLINLGTLIHGVAG